jgi:hypothetical protein
MGSINEKCHGQGFFLGDLGPGIYEALLFGPGKAQGILDCGLQVSIQQF